MKIGSVAWGWTPTPEDMPSGNSLEAIADNVRVLGFDIVDYLSTYESLDTFFTDDKCRAIARHASSIGLDIGGFAFQSGKWNDPEEGVSRLQLDYFRKCAHAAGLLGARMISCIVPGPYGARLNRQGFAAAKVATNLSAGYSWQKDWELFAGMLMKAAGIAGEFGLRVALECFPGSLCSTPHAMLQIVKDVGCGNFGIQLDTAHLANQNIDVETAVFMLGGDNIFNVHAKDTDGKFRNNLPAGSGIVDYTAVLKALANVGYRGNISVEVEFTDNPARYMRQALDHLRLCMEGRY